MRGEGKSLGGSGRLKLWYFTCLGGSGRFILLFFTCLEGVWGGPDSGNLRERVGPLKEPWSSKLGDPGVRGLESLESRSDECLEDCGRQELNVS